MENFYKSENFPQQRKKKFKNGIYSTLVKPYLSEIALDS